MPPKGWHGAALGVEPRVEEGRQNGLRRNRIEADGETGRVVIGTAFPEEVALGA